MGDLDLSVIFLQFLSICLIFSLPVSSKPTAPNVVKFSIECADKASSDPVVGSAFDPTALSSMTIPKLELPKLNLLSKKPLSLNRQSIFSKKQEPDFNTKSFLREAIAPEKFQSLFKRKLLFPRKSGLYDEDMDGSASSPIKSLLPVMPEYLQKLRPKKFESLSERSSALSKKPLLESTLEKLSKFRTAKDMQALPTQEDYSSRSCDICKCLLKSFPNKQVQSIKKYEISKPRSAIENRIKNLVGSSQPEFLEKKIKKPSIDLSKVSSKLRTALGPRRKEGHDQHVMADSFKPIFALPPKGFRNHNDDNGEAKGETKGFGNGEGFAKIIDSIAKGFDPSKFKLPKIPIEFNKSHKERAHQKDENNSEYSQEPSNMYPQEQNIPKEPDYSKEPEYPKEPEYSKEPEYPKEPEHPKEPEFPKEPDYPKNPDYHKEHNYPKERKYLKGLKLRKEQDHAQEASATEEEEHHYPKERKYLKGLKLRKEQDHAQEASAMEEEEAAPKYTEEGIKNLIEFVNIVDHVDKYISDKTRHVITKLSDIYHQDLKDKVI